MSGKPTDVRIVPQNGEWAVKLTGGLGNKPIKITPKLQIAKETARWVAIKNEVSWSLTIRAFLSEPRRGRNFSEGGFALQPRMDLEVPVAQIE